MPFPPRRPRPAMPLAAASLLVVLAACGQTRQVQNDEYGDDSRRARVAGRLAGTDGIAIFGVDRSGRGGAGADQSGALGVNAYLWRAALDTLSFMPVTSTDPFGGVVITDWYSPQGADGERFRAQAYILGRQLRSDGVRVSVFKQELRGGTWRDVAVSPSTASELEDKILARARELRSQTASN